MNELQIIDQREVLGKDFRIYGDFDNPLFIASDVADWIEHSNSREMLGMVDEREKLLSTIFTSGQNREVWLVTEDGLYEILMQSRKPIAKEFKQKVKEILRAIRKTGGYIPIGEADTDEEILAKAMVIANKTIAEQAKRLGYLNVENSRLTVDNRIMQPKADYFDELVDRNLLTSFRDTAKELKVKERMLVNFLLNHKYVFRDQKGKLTPYADKPKSTGLFEVKECKNDKTGWAGQQTLVTPKGRETFRLLLEGLKTG